MNPLLAVAAYLVCMSVLIRAYIWIGEARARRAFRRARRMFDDDQQLLLTALRKDTRR